MRVLMLVDIDLHEEDPKVRASMKPGVVDGLGSVDMCKAMTECLDNWYVYGTEISIWDVRETNRSTIPGSYTSRPM